MSATVTAMIPVLLGSSRVPDKNIILIDGRVLCSYTIRAAMASGVFKDVVLNSEHDIFEGIAAEEGTMFHRRPAEWGGSRCSQKTKSRECLSTRCTINEHYLYQFMKWGTDSDYVCQVNATSPLLKAGTISTFVQELIKGEFNSYFATVRTLAESFIDGNPATFSRERKVPSQQLKPVESICWAIAGWNRKSFIECYEQDIAGEPCPAFHGRLGLLSIDEREALDIDDWSTMDVVEKFLIKRRETKQAEWTYIDGRKIIRGD